VPLLMKPSRMPSQGLDRVTDNPFLAETGFGRKRTLLSDKSRPSRKYCATDLTWLYRELNCDAKNSTGTPVDPDVACLRLSIVLAGINAPSLLTCSRTWLRVRAGRDESLMSSAFRVPILCSQNAELAAACFKGFCNCAACQRSRALRLAVSIAINSMMPHIELTDCGSQNAIGFSLKALPVSGSAVKSKRIKNPEWVTPGPPVDAPRVSRHSKKRPPEVAANVF